MIKFKIANMGILGIILFDMLHRIRRNQFWTNSSEVISKKSHFSYLLTSRWHCAKTMPVASGDAYDDMYQFWFEYAKTLYTYSLMSNLA